MGLETEVVRNEVEVQAFVGEVPHAVAAVAAAVGGDGAMVPSLDCLRRLECLVFRYSY